MSHILFPITGPVAKRLLLLAMVGSLNCWAAETEPPSVPSPAEIQRGYEGLAQIKEFAFGGVGIAGTRSEGEKYFTVVMSSTNALRLFRQAIATGSNEAKLYALVGIQHLDPTGYATASKAMLQNNPEVTTISGCIVTKVKAATVIDRIAKGAYADYIAGPIPSKDPTLTRPKK